MMTSKLDDLKRNYEQIPIPEQLDRVVETALKGSRTRTPRTRLYQSVGIAAAAAVLFVGGANLFPQAAAAMADVPVLGSILKVVTMQEWKSAEGTVSADLKAPGLNGLGDKALESSLNSKYIAENQQLYEKFLAETKKSGGHYSIDSGYEVKTDNDQLLAVGRYTVETQASASESIKYDTIDKKKELVLSLASLFKDDSYIDRISGYITKEMQQRMKQGDESYFLRSAEEPDGFSQITAEQNFYINEAHQLVISFNEYEVAPGYMGIVEFVIPTKVLSGALVGDEYIK